MRHLMRILLKNHIELAEQTIRDFLNTSFSDLGFVLFSAFFSLESFLWPGRLQDNF
jgi:hypothetical protein